MQKTRSMKDLNKSDILREHKHDKHVGKKRGAEIYPRLVSFSIVSDSYSSSGSRLNVASENGFCSTPWLIAFLPP